ncbi:MAG: lysozyme inhibitor LprI family protein [Porticoccaceae bacterium]
MLRRVLIDRVERVLQWRTIQRLMIVLCFACVATVASAASATQALTEKDCTAIVSGSALGWERLANGIAAFYPADALDGGTEIELVFHQAHENCRPVAVDNYGIEGGDPKLEASFIHRIRGESNLFAIVSWPMDHRGLGMTGRFYSVFAYRQSGSMLELNRFVAENREVSSGVVGSVDGTEQTFEGATEEGLIALMGSQGKWSWQAACDPGGNQHELTACAYVAQIEAEEALALVKEHLADAYGYDSETQAEKLAEFDLVQSAWEAQLQADLSALFPLSPGEDPGILYGSSYPMQYANARAFLTRQRADYMRAFWLPADADFQNTTNR